MRCIDQIYILGNAFSVLGFSFSRLFGPVKNFIFDMVLISTWVHRIGSLKISNPYLSYLTLSRL